MSYPSVKHAISSTELNYSKAAKVKSRHDLHCSIRLANLKAHHTGASADGLDVGCGEEAVLAVALARPPAVLALRSFGEVEHVHEQGQCQSIVLMRSVARKAHS